MTGASTELDLQSIDAAATIHIRSRGHTLDPSCSRVSRVVLDSPVKPSRLSCRSPAHSTHDTLFSNDSHGSSPCSPEEWAPGGSVAAVSASGAFTTSATFSNPMFSNPLFADSTFSIMDLDDVALANIFGKLLDEEYPNAGVPPAPTGGR